MDFLQGKTKIQTASVLILQSGLTDQIISLEPSDFVEYSRISDRQFVDECEIRMTSDLLEHLVSGGFLVCAQPASDIERKNLRLDQAAKQAWWDPTALAFHRHVARQRPPVEPKRGYADLLRSADEDAQDFVEAHGKPPAEFYEHPDTSSELLSLPETEWQKSPVGRAIRARRTNRVIERSSALPMEKFSVLIETVFRPHSHITLGSGAITLLRKTSPSGGSLHPIEVFVSAASIEDIPSGIYHYRTEKHALHPVKRLQEGKLRKLNKKFANNQDFAGDAAALFILVARFARHHWKYRNNPKSLAVIYTDAGHLSQTFYLISQEQKLASFYTGSIDSTLLSQELCFDQVQLAPLGLCGCGLPDLTRRTQELNPVLFR